jgi:hypothetical protein
MQYYHCALQNANLWTLEPVTKQSIGELVPASLVDFVAALKDDD